jgi:membrane protein YdbS with pleckstrin-like domain
MRLAADDRTSVATPPHQPAAVRPLPSRSLAPEVITMWRISNLLLGVVPLTLLVAGVSALLVNLTDLERSVGVLVTLAFVLISIPFGLILPSFQYRHWRYEIGEDEVDLLRGAFIITRTLVPMARIQHVDTRSGPIERRLGLATVVLHTAAGSNEIPGLHTADAEALRDQISTIANTYEDL